MLKLHLKKAGFDSNLWKSIAVVMIDVWWEITLKYQIIESYCCGAIDSIDKLPSQTSVRFIIIKPLNFENISCYQLKTKRKLYQREL